MNAPLLAALAVLGVAALAGFTAWWTSRSRPRLAQALAIAGIVLVVLRLLAEEGGMVQRWAPDHVTVIASDWSPIGAALAAGAVLAHPGTTLRRRVMVVAIALVVAARLVHAAV